MSTIIGLDPGLATCGIAIVELETPYSRVVRLDVHRTAPSPKKQAVLSASDTLRRARELSAWLSPWLDTADAVAAERFSAPRNAGAAAKIGWAWGVIAAQTEARRLPVVQPSPQEVHRALCGSAQAAKTEVEAVCRARIRAWPGTDDAIEELEQSHPCSAHEHAWDALAVVLASLDSDLVRAIRPREVAP
jgi:Holliday junction resolvasome RuvABC endonuclease subunit